MLFFSFSNPNIQFAKRDLIWRSYITKKALLTTQMVELLNKNEFAKVAIDRESKTFVVYVVA